VIFFTFGGFVPFYNKDTWKVSKIVLGKEKGAMNVSATPESREQPLSPQEKPLDPKAGEDVSLKGTFAAVMILGVILLSSWLAAFGLFLARQ
jgi:hypothetical protein